MATVLIVDDDRNVRYSLSLTLRKEGYQVHEAKSGEEALACLRETYYDLVLTDLKMPGVGGLEILQAAKEISEATEVMVITAYGSIEAAVKAMKMGAIDFIPKPFNLDQVLIAVGKALERQKLLTEVKFLRERVRDQSALSAILGVSPQMQKLLSLIPAMARSGSTVLVAGETGTGKELIAHALHGESPRRDKPFITVNCAALPDNLLESELFGHAKGAFTGALYAKRGMLTEADGGTVFLDEIGEMSASTQVKVLRFLETGEVRPVGDNRVMRVQVRLLAATNRDLETALATRQFREDLYYRVNVLTLRVPPLRERVEDIPILMEHFLRVFQRRMGRRHMSLSPPAMERLLKHPWPGNVRQLRNVIERAVCLAQGRSVKPEDLQLEEVSAPLQGASPVRPLREVEKQHMLDVLKYCRGNQTRASQILGISKITLWRKLKTYGVDLASFRS